jgi:drug/metabolite transporter (DMT)-like permease
LKKIILSLRNIYQVFFLKLSTPSSQKAKVMTESPTRRAYIIAAITVFIGAIFFSTKAIFVKLAYQYGIDSVSLLTLRMAFSFPVFLGIGFWSFRKKSNQTYQLSRKDWLWSIAMGLLGYYVASLFDFMGLQYISASFERIILYLYPTIVLLISFFLFHSKIRRIHVIALLLTYVGVGIAFYENFHTSEGDDVINGSILVFGAALAYAGYLVGSGQLLPKIGTFRYNSISMSAACFGVFFHNIGLNGFNLLEFAMPVYWICLAMALIATVIPSFMMAEGVRVIGSSNAAIIGSIGPISTIGMAYLFLGERLGWLQWVGTFFVIAGVLLITLQKRGERA